MTLTGSRQVLLFSIPKHQEAETTFCFLLFSNICSAVVSEGQWSLKTSIMSGNGVILFLTIVEVFCSVCPCMPTAVLVAYFKNSIHSSLNSMLS